MTAAELGAAQGISRGLALAQAHRAVALRDRLPKIAELFAAGQTSDLLVRAIVWRTALINDAETMDLVDTALAARVTRWGALLAKKTEQAIDALVDEHDPGALRRTRNAARGREIVIGSPTDEVGFASPPTRRQWIGDRLAGLPNYPHRALAELTIKISSFHRKPSGRRPWLKPWWVTLTVLCTVLFTVGVYLFH